MRKQTVSKYLIFLLSLTLMLFITACGNEEIEIGLTGLQDFEMTVGTRVPDLTEGVGVSGLVLDDLDSALNIDYSSFNPNVVGEYEVIYTLSIPNGEVYSSTITINVVDEAVGNAPFIFGAEDITFIIGGTLPNLMDGVSADDSKFGNLTFIIDVDDSQVDYTEPGTYEVIYHVANADGYHYSTSIELEVTYGESLGDLPEEFFIVRDNGLYGVVDMNGEIIIPIEYLDVEYYGDNMVKLVRNEESSSVITAYSPYPYSYKTLFYDFDNDSFIELEYSDIGYFVDGLASARKGEFDVGYINRQGEEVIPFIYDTASVFENGRAVVGMGNNYGIIDNEGNVLINIMYNELYNLNDNYYEVKIGTEYYILDLSGEIVLTVDSFVNRTVDVNGEEHYIFTKDGFDGLVDSSMNTVIDFKYAYLTITNLGDINGTFTGRTEHIEPFLYDYYSLNSDLLVEDYTSLYYFQSNHNWYIRIGNEETSSIFNAETYEVIITTEYPLTEFFNEDLSLFKVTNSDGLVGIIDEDGTVLFDFEAESINYLGYEYTQFMTPDYYYGIINENGVEITTERYQYIGDFEEGKAVVLDDSGLYGYINTDGSVFVAPQFYEAGEYKDGFAQVTTGYDLNGDPLKIFIDSDGEYISEYRYTELTDFENGFASVAIPNYEVGYLWGFINESGTKVVDTIYNNVEDFIDGYAIVSDVSRSGIIDTTGSIIVPIDYVEVREFSEGLAAVRMSDDTWGFVNTSGTLINIHNYYEVGDFSNGLAPVRNGNSETEANWIYINTNGLKAINEEFYDAGSFNDNLAYVQNELDGKYGYINSDGELELEYIYNSGNDFKDGYTAYGRIVMDTEGNWLFVSGYSLYDTSYGFYVFNPYIENTYTSIYVVDGELNIEYIDTEGNIYTAFTSEAKWGLMDEEENILIEPAYDSIEYSEYYNAFNLTIGDLIGKADLDGNIIAEAKYDRLYYILGDEYIDAVLNQNYTSIIVGLPELFEPIYDYTSTRYEDGFVIVKLGDSYGVYNFDGELIIDVIYDSLTYITKDTTR